MLLITPVKLTINCERVLVWCQCSYGKAKQHLENNYIPRPAL